jgi:hypothetical protein
MSDPPVLSFRPEAGQFAWTFGGVTMRGTHQQLREVARAYRG